MMTSRGYETLAAELEKTKPTRLHGIAANRQWQKDLFAICDALEKGQSQLQPWPIPGFVRDVRNRLAEGGR